MPKNPNIKKVLVISILEHTIVFFFVERVEISSFFRSRVVLFTRIDQDIHAMDLLPGNYVCRFHIRKSPRKASVKKEA